jgi:hypothetical protein
VVGAPIRWSQTDFRRHKRSLPLFPLNRMGEAASVSIYDDASMV